MPNLSLFVPDLNGGGAERVMTLLANKLSERHHVDLVLATAGGQYLDEVASTVSLVELGARSVLKSVPALSRYLRGAQPDVVLSTTLACNFASVASVYMAGSKTRLVLREAGLTSGELQVATATGVAGRIKSYLFKKAYPRADAYVALSEYGARDLISSMNLAPKDVRVIPNPIDPAWAELSRHRPDHPWLREGEPPVILGVGRLSEEKGFDLLLDALTLIKDNTQARLVILGDGPERAGLAAKVEAANLNHRVAFLGFQQNPFGWMRASSVFVLPSRREGFPNALVQALSVGVPLVATDCPGGSSSILGGGMWGVLTPNESVAGLADAILGVLSHAVLPGPDTGASLARYDLERVVTSYESVLIPT